VSVGFVIGAPEITGDGGTVRVGVPLLTQGRRTTVHTRPVSEADAMAIAASVTEGALVDFVTSGREVVVARNAVDTFHTALTKSANPVFVTQKYGPELARRDGAPGAMVAAGWVYAGDRTTITVGDGREITEDIGGRPVRRYEETYRFADGVEVYQVDTRDWAASAPSVVGAIPVTRDHAYTTTDRQAAFVVFDRSYREASRVRGRQVFYLTPRDRSDGKPVRDVPTQSALLADKGVDPVSGVPYADIVATGVVTSTGRTSRRSG